MITANTSFLELLTNAQKASQVAQDQQGRTPYPTLGICTENNDPEDRRRIKVALPSSPQVSSYWINRLVIQPNFDPPMPVVGQTVMVFFVDGLEDQGYYFQLFNDTNPARSKGDAIKDLSEEIPGKKDVSIKEDDSLAVEGKITTNGGDIEIASEKDINAEVKGNILMNALQAISLIAAQYVLLRAGSWFIKLFSNGTSEIGGSVLTVNCGGFGFAFSNVGTFSINGKDVVVLGGKDTDNDTINQRGW